MEHLDSLAGGIAYKHVLGPGMETLGKSQGFYIVTASVDRRVLVGGVCGFTQTVAGSTC